MRSTTTFLVTSIFFLAVPVVSAAPYVIQGPFVGPTAGPIIPGPKNVPGKEYADGPNKDQNGVPAPRQSLLWDGAGGVQNSILFPPTPFGAGEQIDSLANANDALFQEVTQNRAALILGIQGEPRIYYESIGGSTGVWADMADIDANGVTQVNGLEVWGPEQTAGSTHFSRVPEGFGCAVIILAGDNCLAETGVLAASIGLDADLYITGGFNLDALMVSGGNIIFSIRPLGPFDGGELWVLNAGSFRASFLNHGGHLWNTEFDVRAAFGTESENVLDIEAVGAVPEPGSIGLGLFGGAALLLARYRLRKAC